MSEYEYERQNSIIAMDRWEDDNNSLQNQFLNKAFPNNNNMF